MCVTRVCCLWDPDVRVVGVLMIDVCILLCVDRVCVLRVLIMCVLCVLRVLCMCCLC